MLFSTIPKNIKDRDESRSEGSRDYDQEFIDSGLEYVREQFKELEYLRELDPESYEEKMTQPHDGRARLIDILKSEYEKLLKELSEGGHNPVILKKVPIS